MNLRQREILVDKQHAVSILLQERREQLLVHARAEGALEVVVIDGHYLGILVAPCRPAVEIDLLHDLGIRILAQIHLVKTHQRLTILGEQERNFLLAIAVVKGHGNGVVVGKLAWLNRIDRDFHVGRQAVE